MIDKSEYIINTSKDLITLINRDYVYEFVNDSYCKALERNKEDILHHKVADIWGREKFNQVIKKYIDLCFSGSEVNVIEEFQFGAVKKYMNVHYYPLFEDHEVTHVVVFSHDISKLKRLESKLIDYEFRDPTTGLFNRKSLDIVLEMELLKANRSKIEHYRAVLYICLRNLQKVNQTCGYDLGDVIIENTGMKIKYLLRESDYVFRFEGVELIVILTSITKSIDVLKVAQKLYDEITMPYQYKGNDILIKCNIGISIYPIDGTEKEILLRNASEAMHEAKRLDEAIIIYNSNIHKNAHNRLVLEFDIFKGINLEQFVLYYHPIVNCTGKIVGCEALIRWNHPQKGFLMPNQFIPLAEETGMIKAIDKWVFFTACTQLYELLNTYQIFVSVNVSAKSFEHTNLIEIIQDALKHANDLNPKHVKLEITETDCMLDLDGTIKKMNKLIEKGIQFFIDDFGTGQSSLNYLKKLPAEILKLDKTFLEDIENNQDDKKFLASIINMIKSRKKKVLVEGVRTKKQSDILKKYGCDKMQGYYFARPIKINDLKNLLEKNTSLPQTKA